MPLLNRNGEVVETTSISNGATHSGGTTLVRLQDWRAGSGDGVILDVDTEPSEELSTAPIIAIDFPAFSDGRGLSLAVLLRTRYGYDGELRAVGDVQPDLVHYMKRCGFDTFQMPEGRSYAGAEAGGPLAPHTDYYQASVTAPDPAFRRIQRGV